MKLKSISLFLTGFLFMGIQKSGAQTTLSQQPTFSNEKSCGTEVPGEQWEKAFQELILQKNSNRSSGKAQTNLYTIPVIIHVIHGGQSVGSYPNLAQAQINSQIQVLNDDFGGLGFNSGNYPATAFANWAQNEGLPAANLDGLGRVKIANCEVQFCLATVDTLGNPLAEPGIERINYVTKGWSNPASFNTTTSLKTFMDGTVKPQTIWNVSKYLNIWVSDNNINANSLLGYATFPPLSGLSGVPAGSMGTSISDGYWCYARAFGSKLIYPSGTYFSGYERGRISTHEIGHWLGLRHIGGDGNNNPGGSCGATDYCDDTPPQLGGNGGGQYGQNFGSPNYPLFATGNSSCASAVDGCMFMNFMDYTNDNSKYMFTPSQAERIQTAMANSPYRKFLGTHNLCSVNNVAAVSLFNMPSSVCADAIVTLTNVSVGTPVPTYTWSYTGSVFFSPDVNSAAAAVYFQTPGTYVLTLTTDNGTVSVLSKTITVHPYPNLVIANASQPVCMGMDVNLAASGGTAYVWQPGNITGPTVNYTATGNKTYTCLATGPGGCKTSTIVTMIATQCTGLSELKNSSEGFSMYPNPSHDIIYLKSNSGQDLEVFVEIMDLAGKIVSSQTLNFKTDTMEIPLSVADLTSGIYILKVKSAAGIASYTKFAKD